MSCQPRSHCSQPHAHQSPSESESSTKLTLHPTTAQNAENDHSSMMMGPRALPTATRALLCRQAKANYARQGAPAQHATDVRGTSMPPQLRRMDTHAAVDDCVIEPEPPEGRQRSDAAPGDHVDRVVIERHERSNRRSCRIAGCADRYLRSQSIDTFSY
jgi:hypothetical protein